MEQNNPTQVDARFWGTPLVGSRQHTVVNSEWYLLSYLENDGLRIQRLSWTQPSTQKQQHYAHLVQTFACSNFCRNLAPRLRPPTQCCEVCPSAGHIRTIKGSATPPALRATPRPSCTQDLPGFADPITKNQISVTGSHNKLLVCVERLFSGHRASPLTGLTGVRKKSDLHGPPPRSP